VTGHAGFVQIPADGEPLRLVLVGAGGMGRGWLQVMDANDDVQIVGIVDVNEAAAVDAAAIVKHSSDIVTGTDVLEVSGRANAQAIVDVTIPEAHYPVTVAALLAGYPVLGEKPVAATVAEGLSLSAAAQSSNQLFMVSQSRRYNHNLHQAKQLLSELGQVGVVSVDFYKSVHFGGFREEMASPLLLDMAIHQFDMARFLLDADPISVGCEEYNPGWSWYSGDAAASAVFEMSNGARFIFNGSWCSPGAETSWNGSWRISAESGTVLWDGDNKPSSDPLAVEVDTNDPGTEIEGSLREFVAALRTGDEPMGRVHTNVLSFAMVEAAIRSARTGRRVQLDEVLDESYTEALGAEKHPELLAVLKSWSGPSGGLSAPRGTATP
jgi:predicted dehydrogenase